MKLTVFKKDSKILWPEPIIKDGKLLKVEKLEELFEKGKISQSEYEAILEYRKKLKKDKNSIPKEV